MQAHRGALRVAGTAPDRLEFQRPHERRTASLCATAVPRAAPAAATDLHADALDALRRLGFCAAEARQALAVAASGGGDLETLLRRALTYLRPPVQVSRACEPTARYVARRRCAAPSRDSRSSSLT